MSDRAQNGGGGQGARGRPPHPATVVQRKAPHSAAAGQRRPSHPATVVQRKGLPPHPATVVQPKAPHPATVACRPYLLVQRAAGPDVTGWKFKKFKDYLLARPKGPAEDWNAYADRHKQSFSGYSEKEHGKFFSNAIEAVKKAAQVPAPQTPVKSKAKLWSRGWSYRNERWREPTETRNLKEQRPTTNGHSEQLIYRGMYVQSGDWIGFTQNEYPCISEGCCEYFSNVSNEPGVAGVIFNVVDSGGYARDHGREPGSSAVIYFIKGNMYYEPPDDDDVDVPPKPPS